MVVAALLAALLNFSALRARDDTVRIAVAAHEVPAGAPIAVGAVRFMDARLDEDVVATLLSPERAREVAGWIATHPIAPGEPIRASDLRAPAAPEAQRAMSLPIDPAHAVAGALRSGDRIDVIAVRDGAADYLVTDAAVLAVSGGGERGGLGGAQRYSVTLAVDEETALRLATALRTGELDVVRSTGSSAVQPAPGGAAAPDGETTGDGTGAPDGETAGDGTGAPDGETAGDGTGAPDGETTPDTGAAAGEDRP
ncbi:MAG: Flp pilus assembly protein CpaB [Egibacteraceae bacterium]